MFAKFFGRDPSKSNTGSAAPPNANASGGGGGGPHASAAAAGGGGGHAAHAAAHSTPGPTPGDPAPPPSHSALTSRVLHPVADATEIGRRLKMGGAFSISSVFIPQYRVKGHYVEYVVECTQGNACWRVFRRYQQFKALDQALRPLCARGTPNHGDYGVLPLLPGSHWMEVTNQSPELVDRRRRFLEIYLQQLLVPRNLFYVAHTPLYGFLHDGEVPVDVKAVSVQPLLGLATMHHLADSSSPFQSPTEMPLAFTVDFEGHALCAEGDAVAPTSPAATPPEEGSDAAANADVSVGPTRHADAALREVAAGGGSMPGEGEAPGGFDDAATDDSSAPSDLIATARARREGKEDEGRESIDASGAAAHTRITSRRPSTSSAETPGCATNALRDSRQTRAAEGRSASPASSAALDDISAWDSEDVPSEERWAHHFAGHASSSVRGAAVDGGGGGGDGGRSGASDERLPPPAPNCLHCSRDFDSTLYPHRCYFCRARFCRNCLWHVRIATETSPPEVEAMNSPLRKLKRRSHAASRNHQPLPPPDRQGHRPDTVNACLQCTENYKRRWSRHHNDGGSDTNSQGLRPSSSSQQQQHRQQQQLGTHGGLTSSSLSSTPLSTGTGLAAQSMHAAAVTAAPLCTPSLRPTQPHAASTASSASLDGAARAGGSGGHGQATLRPSRQSPSPPLQPAEPIEALRPNWGKLSVLAPPSSMRVGLEDFQLLTCLGRGTFGRVMKVKLRATDTVYAMKVMNKSVVYKRFMTSYIKEEKNILTTLPPHPYVVRCHFAFQSDYYLFFILDYLPGGELYDLMYPVLRITPREAQLYAAELVLAIEHIHRYDVVHRDIKPENIVLDRDGHVKLTDFGLARKNFSHTRRRSFVGSAEYVAPETIQGEFQTPALDWWSLGVLLFEMLAGQAPFHADNNNAVYENVMHKTPDFHDTRVFPPEARSLIEGLLTRDVAARLQDAAAIRAHPYFAGVDWQALRAKEVPALRVPYLAENDVRHFKREFTSEWPAVPPPTQLATRNSLEMLYRCFDNFTISRDRVPSTNTTTARKAGATPSTTMAAAGRVPPPLDLGAGPSESRDAASSPIPEAARHRDGDAHGPPPEGEEEETGAPCGRGAGRPHGPLSQNSSNSRSNNSSGSSISGAVSARSRASHASQPPVSSPALSRPLTPASRTQPDLLGVWRLLKVETCALDGRVIYPWGGDVIGILAYLPTGHYAMQLCPLRRRQLRHPHIAHATKEELGDVFCSYAAQFGKFVVAPAWHNAPSHRQRPPQPPQPPCGVDGAWSEHEERDEGRPLDLWEAATSVVWHRVEGHLCPNMAQRVVKMRFDVEETANSGAALSPRRQSLQSHQHLRNPSLATSEGDAGSIGSGAHECAPPVKEESGGDGAGAHKAMLRLMTEPEGVMNESFQARTIMTWVRVKAPAAAVPHSSSSLSSQAALSGSASGAPKDVPCRS